MYISICETGQSPGLMHEIGLSGLVNRDKPAGWVGEGGVKGFRMGTHIHHG